MNKYILLILFLNFVASSLFSENYMLNTLPKDWYVYSTEEVSKSDLQCANYSRNEWMVQKSKKSIIIKPYKEQDIDLKSLPEKLVNKIKAMPKIEPYSLLYPSKVLRMKSGWFVGYDAGEWGGSLWWFEDKQTKPIKIINENIVQVVMIGDNAVNVITGLAHLTEDEGNIFILKYIKNKWKNIKNIKMDSAPLVTFKNNDGLLYILTYRNLMELDSGNTLKEKFKHEFGNLYPNSLTIDDAGKIYIGMRHFVVVENIKKQKRDEIWCLPKGCKEFHIPDITNPDCVCK